MSAISEQQQRPQVWLRCETKPLEQRAALSPANARRMIDAGYEVLVERDSQQRIFRDEEYEQAGCTMVEHDSWHNAPTHIPILGLKELPETGEPLPHTHIHFAHCFKNQGGWRDVILRYHRGNGLLYDLEFLQDERGRRVAAFGYYAGFAGAAAALLALAARRRQGSTGALGEFALTPYPCEDAMIRDVRSQLASVGSDLGDIRACIIGALGRCGRGAGDLLTTVGLREDNILRWDMAETARGGPFPELLDVDIVINCIYLTSAIPPFMTLESVAAAGPSRRLAVISDVSCDPSNPNNPLPIYHKVTTFDHPTEEVVVGQGNPALSLISIDHLPTLLPREASEAFSSDLLPTLLELRNRQTAGVWVRAEDIYRQKVQEAMTVSA